MNRPWLYSEYILDSFHGGYTVEGLTAEIRARHGYLVELERAAIKASVPIRAAFQGTDIGAFRVLAPRIDRYVSLIHEFDKTPTSYAESAPRGVWASLMEGAKSYLESWGLELLSESPEPTSASNESSVVQLARIDDELILLTGDVGPIALAEAKDYLDSTSLFTQLNVFQVPHHGSRRNVTPTVLTRWLGAPNIPYGTRRGIAICSLGKDKTEFPRKRVSNACFRRGFPIYTTRASNLRHHKNMGERAGYSSMAHEPFVAEFEE